MLFVTLVTYSRENGISDDEPRQRQGIANHAATALDDETARTKRTVRGHGVIRRHKRHDPWHPYV